MRMVALLLLFHMGYEAVKVMKKKPKSPENLFFVTLHIYFMSVDKLFMHVLAVRKDICGHVLKSCQ